MHRRCFNRLVVRATLGLGVVTGAMAGGSVGTVAMADQPEGDPDADKKTNPEIKAVTVYIYGKEVLLRPDLQEVRHVEAEGRRILHTANGILRIVVNDDLMTSIQQDDVAIEIRYKKTFTVELINLPGQKVTLDRMLLPIKGQFTQGVSTIFVGTADGYGRTAYRSDADIQEVRRYVAYLVNKHYRGAAFPPF